MGHGSNDKLYITHTEHSEIGSHSSSRGYRKKDSGHPKNITPFNCCSLSYQPFSHPVCARNADGTGDVYDLVNIIPWLKEHDNTHPVFKTPLAPGALIKLNYSKKASGELHDPISFKPFGEHSHIVAIATTGNVFLAESIKGNKDLVDDIKFKKEDIITLQNPHAFPTFSVAAVVPQAETSKAVTKPAAGAVQAVKAKAAVPWNVSPYSSGLLGASLTSTSVDPQTESSNSKLVWDEEELMFEDISNPLKGKGKDKDVGKRRAYVRVVTSLGGGSLNMELYCEKAPKTCYNFLQLARQGKYDNCLFHRLVPGFMIQTGDPTGTGSGGESCWGMPFRDEHDLKGAAKHDGRGVIAMANKGPGTNGSQFYVTFKAAANLDKKHTVFGKLVGGEDVLDTLEKIPTKAGTERPAKPIKIVEVIIYQDPFEEYKTRLAKRLAKRAEGEARANPNIPVIKDANAKKVRREGDEVNWFGEKMGESPAVQQVTFGGGSSDTGPGVGKYLNLKRPLEGAGGSAGDSSKKKKTGFGDFGGW